MNTNVIGARISTKWFEYDSTSTPCAFVQEVSTLQANNCGDPLGRLYNDACDQGFVLVSHRTFKEVPYYLDSVDRDREGDVQGWHFKPALPRDAALPQVLIIND